MMKKLLFSTAMALLVSAAFAQTQVPMPAQSSTFSGNVRGYYFVAPSCFTITGVEVPTTASTGAQSIAIVRFYATPPTFSLTTNAFTVLYLTQNNPTPGTISVNIQVEQGDIIGVLGQRSNVNSYGNNTGGTTIDGFPVAIPRLGMQFPLTTTAPQQLWTEPTSTNISRVWLYYNSGLTFAASSTPTGPNSFQFTNGADTSFTSVWDYGDGSPLDTVIGTASHTYLLGGTYTVCSYITTTCGTDTVCTSITACGADPIAAFTSAPSGASVSFTDNTNNATTWFWDFGDGNNSTVQNPAHTYSASGTYNVCLIAGNPCGVMDTICQQVTVCVPVVASYSSSANGATVSFTDMSSGGANTWYWDFGDGNNSTVQNPSNTYANSGTYNVCLIALSGCAVDTFCTTVTVCVPVSATYTSSSSGDSVMFTDGSTGGATSWYWDFGDGNNSTAQNPTNVYAVSGTYTVCLIAASACSSDTLCTTVTVCIPVVAAYTSSASSPGTVQFTDGSTGGATSWFWDFGDGNNSTQQNPSNVYVSNGTYYVCLIASSSCASDTICDSVTVCAPVAAAYSSTSTGSGVVQFTDGSSNATSWSWDFGDSGTSSSQSPSHTYTANGTYTVCLVASNACSSDSSCQVITICPQLPTAAFTTSGNGLVETFTNNSQNAVSYFWDFGDGNNSTSQNPVHTYPNTGVFTVCLTSYNLCGDSVTNCETITVQVSGIAQNNSGMIVTLSPNPMAETALFHVSHPGQNGQYTFELRDVRGAVVRTQSGRYNENLVISKGELAGGVYLYRAINETGLITTGKLVVR